ncbi:MAG: hypothetical protein FD149_2005 [Rhodospirillaceae bacterium]|nr:MAG: hypothetical protein FD149_2005 [Rhodospirillaceae bacterium]
MIDLDLKDIPPQDLERFLAFRARVAGANIDDKTLLATDYLNHFNEIVMLLEMVPDMPEILEDAKAWEPKSYTEHFRDSTFSDKELAIEAYAHVPTKFRVPFEETVEHINRLIAQSLMHLENTIATGDEELLRLKASTCSRAVQKLMDVASAIIHGSSIAMQQSEIDEILA